MFKIGDIEVKGKVILAPMAGVSSFTYRHFMSDFDIDLCVTEMVSDMGLIYGNKETFSYIDFPKEKVPTGVQLFGHDVESLKKALLIVEEHNPNVAFYDVNMGCPVPKVVDTGAGSALMKNPKLCGDIIRGLKSVTNKPVTAKIRLGWDKNSINFLEVIKELESAGVDMIAIHARTRKELYTGEPHWDYLKNLRSQMKVPLVVSGNIYTVEDAIKALEITGADAVMVARGGVGNPLLSANINRYFRGEELIKTSIEKQVEYCKKLAQEFVKEKGEVIGMRVYRSIGPQFFSGYKNVKKLKNRICLETETYHDLEKILDEYLKEIC